jgi:hypothetical protein
VRSHFGIDVWISSLRLPPLRFGALKVEKWRSYEAHETTLAYLTLPNSIPSCEKWSSIDNDLGKFQSGAAIPVELGAVPTRASLRRFPRALTILGLEVFIHPSQNGDVISVPSDVQLEGSTAAADESTTEWPQLTLLTT